MQTIILNIDNKSNATKILEALQLFKGVKDASLIDDSPYDPKAVKEIQESMKQMRAGKGTKIKTEDLWK